MNYSSHNFRTRFALLLPVWTLSNACVATWLLTTYTDSPVWTVILIAGTIGWALFRFAGVSTLGVVLWCFSASALSMSWWAPLSLRADWLMCSCGVIGFFLPLASSIAFLAAAKNRRTRAANCGACVLALFTLITSIAAHSVVQSSLSNQLEIDETSHTLIMLHALGNDIEAIRARLGRLPSNEEELVRLRGKPMPWFGSGHYPISYYRSGDGGYELHCSFRSFWGYHWDMFGYVASYRGPNASPRLQVDLF